MRGTGRQFPWAVWTLGLFAMGVVFLLWWCRTSGRRGVAGSHLVGRIVSSSHSFAPFIPWYGRASHLHGRGPSGGCVYSPIT